MPHKTVSHLRTNLSAATMATATLASLVIATTTPAKASSHREAPFITRMPKVDGTDLYMFRSYETGRSGFVTLIANYYPLQDPSGRPQFSHDGPRCPVRNSSGQ